MCRRTARRTALSKSPLIIAALSSHLKAGVGNTHDRSLILLLLCCCVTAAFTLSFRFGLVRWFLNHPCISAGTSGPLIDHDEV
jgi:hypothetical protein